MPSQSDKKKALRALDGVVEIAKNEMLAHAGYITSQVQNPELAEAGAICGGRRACLLGSLWLSAGVRFRPGHMVGLPGILPHQRKAYLRRHPDLKLAYDALNEAAVVRFKRFFPEEISEVDNDPEPYAGYASAAEGLFEGTDYLSDATTDAAKVDKVRSLVNSAKRIVATA